MGDLPAHLQHESFIRKGDKKNRGPDIEIAKAWNGKAFSHCYSIHIQ